jgi:hypothetical protein
MAEAGAASFAAAAYCGLDFVARPCKIGGAMGAAQQGSLQMAGRGLAPLLLLLTIGGCTSATDPAPASIPLDNPPEYRQIVKAALQADAAAQKIKKPKAAAAKPTTPEKAAKDAKAADKPDNNNKEKPDPLAPVNRVTRISNKYAWTEISKPRPVNIIAGWSWQVCLKGKNKSAPVYLAVFLQSGIIRDARTATAIDKCESEPYEPL